MKQFLNRKGQSIVEITLMTPLILVALYVPVDFGVTLFTGHLTQNAVRDGVRIASRTTPMNSTAATTIATQVYNNLPQMLVSGTAATKRVTVTYFASGAAECQQSVQVRAQGTYEFFLYRLIALVGFSPPNPVQIARTTRMHYDVQPYSNGGTGSTTTPCATATATGSHPAAS